MKFYGNANLQQNELQQAVIPIDAAFPPNPKVGQFAFPNRILYICVSISEGLPVWVPLTRELTMYAHTQSLASDTWTVNHNLNTTGVQVQIFDNAGRVVIPDEITIVSANQVTVEFNSVFVGRAVILTGHNDGSVKPTYSYTHYQSIAENTWVIDHGLGYNPIARVFIGNAEVQPVSITHNSTTQMTIAFSQPYAGVVKLV
jgi:phage tail protein X